MRIRSFLGLLVLGAIGLASSAQAQIYAQPLETYGQSCFVYNNYAYLPLRSVTGFLGASVELGGTQANIVIGLDGNTLGLIPGSTQAYFNGSPVALPVPPFDINGVTMVPVSLFHDYFFTDIDWQPSLNRVFLYGPSGWGYCDVLARPPVYARSVIQNYGVPFYGPSAFYYDGVPFVSFHDWDDFFGFPLFFEPDRDDFVLVVRGREFIFAIGSPFVFFGNERFLLPASPVLVGNRVFVPVNFFALPPIGAPIEVVGNVIRARGPMGMRQVRIDPRAPARIATTLPRQPRQLGIPVRPAVIPGVVTPTPRPPMQALHPRVPPRVTAARPAPPVVTARPPTTAVRPLPPTTAVRPTPPRVAAVPSPQVRPAPRAMAPPTVAARPLPPQARPMVPALRPGIPPEAMRQQGRIAMAPPRTAPQVQQRAAPERPQVQQRPAPERPQAQQRPAPGRPQAQQTPAPQRNGRGGQGQARGRQQGQG